MFTKSENKPFFLLRMCEKIENATVRLTLPGAYKWVEWRVPQNRNGGTAAPIPDGLVDALLEAFDCITSGAGGRSISVEQNNRSSIFYSHLFRIQS